MKIQLQHIPIHPQLRGLVEKLWVFESSGRVPSDDMKIIVPNGLVKLVIPFNNGLVGQKEGYSRVSKRNQLTLIGISDVPFIVDAEADAPAGTIGVEFSPLGAYRFFNLRLTELKNQIFLIPEVVGKHGKEVEELIAEAETIEGKLEAIQKYLIRLLLKTQTDPIFEYCVQRIKATHGRISVKELEKETGYSSRWLNMKFDERIGISPKNLCAITRFQLIFNTLANNPKAIFQNKAFYQIYYDQSHFIKEFKRFTGMPPLQFENSINDFGKIFYKQ